MEETELLHDKLRHITVRLENIRENLRGLGAHPSFIVEHLLQCDVADYQRYIEKMGVRIEQISLAIEQLRKYDIDLCCKCDLYYFSKKHGVVTSNPLAILCKNSWYDGEEVTPDIEMVVPKLLIPELDDAIERSDLEASMRITNIIKRTLEKIQSSKGDKNG